MYTQVVNRQKDGQTDRWMKERWIDRQMDRKKDKEKKKDGWIDRKIDRQVKSKIYRYKVRQIDIKTSRY